MVAVEHSVAPPAGARSPGWVAAVFDRSEIRERWTFGHADLAAPRPLTPTTRLRWFSITKLVTATLVMQLVERGRVGLDDPITAHLPWARLEPATPTVAQLLSHSAGLADPSAIGWVHPPGAARRSPGELTRETLSRHRRLRAAPGSETRYTNLGYLLLGELLAARGEGSYAELSRSRVLAPIGLRRVGLSVDDAAVGHEALVSVRTAAMGLLFVPRSARMVRYVRGGWVGLAPFELEGEAYGGLLGSHDDLVALGRLFLREGEGVLEPESARAMMRPVAEGAGGRFGLGFWIYEDGWVGHGGEAGGFRSELLLHPARGLGVAILANSGVATIDRVREALVRRLG